MLLSQYDLKSHILHFKDLLDLVYYFFVFQRNLWCNIVYLNKLSRYL